MCGILGIFDVAPGTTQSTLRAKLIECARRMRHRGPDWSGYQLISQGKDKQELGAGQHASSESLQRLCIAEHGVRGAAKHAIAHERLAIIDPESGAQPLFAAECKDSTGKILIEEGSIIVAANGEIYNYKELYDLLKKEGVPYEPNTGSDCEVLIPLYVKFGLEKACSLLRGADLRGNQSYGALRPARRRGGSRRSTCAEHRARSTRPRLMDTSRPRRYVFVHHLRPADGFLWSG
jgi:asparagine synthase (glutamine-hydrolysing)